MSASPAKQPRAVGATEDALHPGDPVAHFVRLPGKVEIAVKGPDSLFDRSASPTYPHTGPMVNGAVAKFLVDSVREQRQKPNFEVTFVFETPRLSAEEEATARAQVSRFFLHEVQLATLAQKVNRSEGFGALRYSFPVLLVAGLVAGLLAATVTVGATLLSLVYIAVIVVVWVALWDPIEILLFDSYFIRLRIRALRKLAAAKITFVYRPAAGTSLEPLPD